MLRAPAVPSGWARQFHDRRLIVADLFFDDLTEGNIRGTEVFSAGDQWTADAAVTGVELADALGNHVDQDVGVQDGFEGFFYKERIHFLLG
jgi:hypothetical protein